MKAYIYFIINKVNGKRYVGQTTDFSRRKHTHLKKLRTNTHENKKLQNAWNKYGEENFEFQRLTYEGIDSKDLDILEMDYISKYDSKNNGYNNTDGGKEGEGNNSRGKLTFEQYAYIFLGNTKYKGLTTRTAKVLGIDSSTVSAIKNLKSYVWFQDDLDLLTNKEKQEIIKRFEKDMDIENNPPWTIQKTLDEETTFQILCFVSTYGRGAERFCLDKFNLSKGFVFHFIVGKTRENIKQKYKSLTQEEIEEVGQQCWENWGKPKLKKEYKNLKDRYPNRDF